MSTGNERRYALLKHTHTADDIEGDVGGGLTDGDYGDVTVSGTGTVITIDNGVVSNAKLADVPTDTVKGRTASGTGSPTDLTMDELRAMLGLGQGSEVRGASFIGFNAAIRIPANKVSLTIKEDCTITKCVVLTQGGTGSCVIDIQSIPYTSYPPTGANSIVGATPPTITSGIKYQDTSLSDWDVALSEGDTVQFELVSSSTFTAIYVFLVLQPVDSTPADGYTDERVRTIVQEELANFSVVVDGDDYTVNLTPGDFSDLIVWDLIGQPTGVVNVTFNTANGSHICASSTGSYALDWRGFTSGSTLAWVNGSFVNGHGGKGGRGASAGNTFGEDGGSGRRGISGHGAGDGEDGGHAVAGPDTGVTLDITNANGYIFGGGGGGPGGGASLDFGGDTNAAAGGGGGGGAGGGQGGDEGVAIVSNTTTATEIRATRGRTAGAARTSTGGTAGVGNENGTAEGGDGGDGGDYGEDGATPTASATGNRDYAAGTPGTAGKAIDLQGGTVTFLSGNDSTHVKGDVS